ncbi:MULTISPECIES: NAD(P)/FAD-dependent oxidoreductase [Silvimonas]|uniref:NAD(P)/FAD-dependent oxidoreductase n=1 Tax=Silvimonas TaxID=300264 RepID=UPI0024B383AC|nr:MULTISPECIES: NAD(P)/FAD-dependent oxidoreductase [Silvimonas]MDR3429544.1 NAD(P)/FAD-dependent oxidoreductase [Silvimonas sp.]
MSIATEPGKPHRIVIVGGGAGGLELATRLGHNLGRTHKAKVTLVDGSPTHIWKPLLHEVATGALNTGEDEVNYFAHAHRHGYEFEFGFMSDLDREEKTIRLDAVRDEDDGTVLTGPRLIPYDTLVLAVGAICNDFGTPGVQENCMQLNTPTEADRLRKRILGQSFIVGTANDPLRELRISIIGAGPTGVELAAEIHHAVTEAHNYGSHLAPAQLRINIIEAAPRILSGAPESLSLYATTELERRHISVLTNSKVAQVNPDSVSLADGRIIPSDIIVWAAGVKAAPWLSTLGLQTNRNGQIEVTSVMQTVTDKHIFAIGDCAFATDGEGGPPLNATAQVAHQQARWLAQMLEQYFEGREVAPFRFKPQGIMVSLGKSTAVGSLAAVVGPKRDYYVEGLGAKLIYSSLYRMHQAALHGWFMATLLYLGDKLRRIANPALKLH